MRPRCSTRVYPPPFSAACISRLGCDAVGTPALHRGEEEQALRHHATCLASTAIARALLCMLSRSAASRLTLTSSLASASRGRKEARLVMDAVGKGLD